MSLLLHPNTLAQLDAFIDSRSHALLIEGPPGSGKSATIDFVVAQMLAIPQNKLDNHSFLLRVQPVDNVIPISAIREMRQFVRLKTIGDSVLRRGLIIEDAHRMTIEAQNALLKLLEEPPSDTIIIFSASSEQKLLRTIYSRAQHITIRPPDKTSVQEYFGNQGKLAVEIEHAYNLSEGHMGLMNALLNGDDEHPLKTQIDEAKKIVSATAFERLAIVDRLSKQKDQIPGLLYTLQRVYRAVLMQASVKNSIPNIFRAHAALERLLDAEQMLKQNPNPKLLLTDLFLGL